MTVLDICIIILMSGILLLAAIERICKCKEKKYYFDAAVKVGNAEKIFNEFNKIIKNNS